MVNADSAPVVSDCSSVLHITALNTGQHALSSVVKGALLPREGNAIGFAANISRHRYHTKQY